MYLKKRKRLNCLCSLIILVCILTGCTAAATGGDAESTQNRENTLETVMETVAETDSEAVTEPVTEVVTQGTTVAPTKEPATKEVVTKETVPETVPDGESFTLTFVGDCTLGTMPTWMSYPYCFNKVIGTNYDFPFKSVKKYFEADDCTFVNLESVLAESGTPEIKQFTFMGPTAYVNIMTGSSVEFANLSNNHSYDFGEAGYISTKKTLENAGVSYVEKNSATMYTTKSGLKIGVYGVYFALDKKDMLSDVAALKAAGAEVIVAAVHWGEEAVYTQNGTQISIGHQLIDAGVDIVWGHHPHVLQPVEKYHGGIIYYSMGNFSFGGNHNPGDKDTAVFQQQVVRKEDGDVVLGKLTVIPCSISSMTERNDFQPTPYPVNSAGYNRVFSKLKWRM